MLDIGKIYASSWKSADKGIIPQEYLETLDKNRGAKRFENMPAKKFYPK